MSKAIILLTLVTIWHAIPAQEIPCERLPNGSKQGDPQILERYYVCVDSVPIPVVCPKSLIFCSVGVIRGCFSKCPAAAPLDSGEVTDPKPPVVTTTPTNPPPITPTPPSTGITTAAPTSAAPTTAASTTAAATATTPGTPATGGPTVQTTSTSATTTKPITSTTTTTKPPPITKPPPPQCANDPDGTFFPVPNECSSYIICENKVAIKKKCINDYEFNPLMGTCDTTKICKK